ncbi:ABC transporter permease subunit [Clostridium sp. HMP27]|uniref:ABC transporter permease subunit n=1 Tax=Clostridium sp. HMP27 TaxID=1487921 RepID=UPI00052C9800|nr:ABC transporter permease subunit [Clostridium sp. HMP27]KGK89954.1 ABC transporter permease [Clostridium sp. HMP27]
MNVFKMEVKNGMRPLSIWSIICVLLTILFMSMFPSMKDSGMKEIVNTKMDAMPQAILEAFNLKSMPDFTKLNEYFAYVFQYIVIAGGIYAGMLGAKSLIKEESEGTIEFLYAQPISRNKIVTMKILSSLALFYIFVVIIAVASTIISLIVKPSDLKIISLIIDLKMLFSAFMLVGLVFMAVGFLLSSLISHLRLAMPIFMGFFFTTYLLGMFSNMIGQLKFLKYFSPFHYAVPLEIIKDGFDGISIALALVIIFLSISITYITYRKKDFRI